MKKILLGSFLVLNAMFMNAQEQPRLGCATDLEWEHQVKLNPELAQARLKFEEDFARFKTTYNVEDYKVKQGSAKKAAKYIIPVVVHVFHSDGNENITDLQVINTINNMNKYYSGTIPGINKVRSIFKDLIADCEIEFRLATKDPNQQCTNGIVRVYTPQTYRGNDLVKALSAWDTRRYLNIWVTQSVYSGATAVGGYAYLPFGGGKTSLNGVIVVASQFISDNTGAHEAGHWLGLYHPFQSADSCSTQNDEIDDTPPTYFKMANNGVNSGRGNHCGDTAYNTCSTSTPINTPDLPDQQENIMDYFSGPCSGLMFTWQQKARMIFCLENFRKELISQENLVLTGTNDGAAAADCAPVAAFNTKAPVICAGGTTTFFDFSYNAAQISTYAWEFPGGSPSTFNGKFPTAITYSQPGTYTVKLTVTNAKGTHTTTYEDYIKVLPASAPKTPGWRATADWWHLNNWEQEGWRFEYEYSSNKFQRVATSYNQNAGMMLAQDPNNAKNSLSNSFSLVSPSFNFEGASSPYFAFNYAFARGTQFSLPTDESVILYTSSDCGKNWSQRANLSGVNASTIGNATLSSAIDFVPSEPAKWKEVVFQGPTFPKVPNLMFKITFKYEGGNNFYLDNVRTGSVAMGVGNLDGSLNGFVLHPNPVTGVSAITYELANEQHVTIQVFDLLGKEVATVFNTLQQAGNQSVAIDKNKLGLTNGVYLVRLSAQNSSITRKFVVE